MPLTLISLDYRKPRCDTSLAQLPVVIGSSTEAEICLDDHSVSREHCRIDEVDGQLIVTDLDSVHGTYVNGRRVRESVLAFGDTLSVGLMSFLVQRVKATDRLPKPVENGLVFGTNKRRRSAPLICAAR